MADNNLKTHSFVSIEPVVSLADVRQLSPIFNRIFGRDPGTSFLYDYPARDSPDWDYAVSSTLSLRTALLRRHVCDPRRFLFIAKVDHIPAGFSSWTPPENDTTIQRHVPLSLRLLGLFNKVYDKVVSFVYPTFIQRIFDPASIERLRRRTLMRKADKEAMESAIPPDVTARGYWTLAGLGVSEEHGRRGIGSKLLEWGCTEADKTDRAIVISASVDGEKLYSRCGFETMKRITLEDEQTGGSVRQAYMIRYRASDRKKQ